MRKISLFLFLIAAVAFKSFGQELPERENDTIIVWTQDRKLTWNDFQRRNLKGPKAAQSDIGIDVRTRYNGNKNFKYVVFAYFYKRESFTETNKLDVLKHEQVHFDIAELFARKMRFRLHQLSREAFNKQKYLRAIDAVYEEYFLFQKRYDKETKHSISKDGQKEWNLKVADALDDMKDFQSKEFTKEFNN